MSPLRLTAFVLAVVPQVGLAADSYAGPAIGAHDDLQRTVAGITTNGLGRAHTRGIMQPPPVSVAPLLYGALCARATFTQFYSNCPEAQRSRD